MLLPFCFRIPGQDLFLILLQQWRQRACLTHSAGTGPVHQLHPTRSTHCIGNFVWHQHHHFRHHTMETTLGTWGGAEAEHYQSRRLLLPREIPYIFHCFYPQGPAGMDEPCTKGSKADETWLVQAANAATASCLSRTLCLCLPDIQRQGELSKASQLSATAIIICKETQRREKAFLVSLKLIYSNGNVIRKDKFSSQQEQLLPSTFALHTELVSGL